MDFLAGLNPQQKKAVETVNGRILVLAGAGSGKTRVLTLRMAHLIKNLSVSPRSILGLTFTNKAAAEMRHRLLNLIEPSQATQVTFCTFHSFCMQILRTEIHRLGFTSQFTLYDEKDVMRLISTIARDLLEYEGQLPSLSSAVEVISYAKNRGLRAEEISGTGSVWHDQFTRDLYLRLEDSMRAYNAVDFDSLLYLCVELFQKNSDILDKYQERYQYIMIDEYQDTNPIQYRLASLLSAKYSNLCVVGDDDQSIYGWRGAEVENILGFRESILIKLEQNYRSTNIILKAANHVIAHNQKRHEKALWSHNGDGELIEIFHAPNEKNEAEAVVFRMEMLRQKRGLRWQDMAILYRSNALSRPFEIALMKHLWEENGEWKQGIPYQISGGIEFYDRREVKDLLAYLRIIINPFDEEAILRIINYPRRGIGESALDILTAYNRANKESLWNVLSQLMSKPEYKQLKEKINFKALKGIEKFLDIINTAKNKFAQQLLSEAITWLIEALNYRKAIDEEVKSSQMRQFKWENVEEFIRSLSDYEQRIGEDSGQRPSLQDFLLSMPFEKYWNRSESNKGDDNKVTLMTFHSAKGLEFPACFLVGMEDHILPHEKSLKQTGIEEERRLMYVGMTRAMKYLVVSMSRQRKRLGIDSISIPSRFLHEIPKEYLRVTFWHEIDSKEQILKEI